LGEPGKITRDGRGGNCARRMRRRCTRRGIAHEEGHVGKRHARPFFGRGGLGAPLTPGIPPGIYEEALDFSGWNSSV